MTTSRKHASSLRLLNRFLALTVLSVLGIFVIQFGILPEEDTARSNRHGVPPPRSWERPRVPPPRSRGRLRQKQTTTTTTTSGALKQHYNVCIVGAGLSGAVMAERYATVLQQSVLILEKRNHLGGNCYDYIDKQTNLRVSKYGAHLFHTNSRRVWDYVQRFAHWTLYEHKVLGLVQNQYVPIPVNIDTVNALFNLSIATEDEMKAWLAKEQVQYYDKPQNSREMALSRVGPRLYQLIFEPYTIKQWARDPAELGPQVTARIPVRTNHDGRYFSDPYQALPTAGYTRFFERLLLEESSKQITVLLNTDFFQVRHSLNCDRLYYTGPIDAYFADTGWPALEYRSLNFERVVAWNTTYYQPAAVVNHPSLEDNFTRIVEYKHFLKQSSPHTVYFIERSQAHGEPYYPVPNAQNQALYAKYQALAALQKEQNVTFVGRLANYKYFNMDQAILNALQLFDQDTGISEHEQWTDWLAPAAADSNKKNSATTAETNKMPLKTHWCILDKKYSMKIDSEWFLHFPHASEAILPCWSWFRKRNATENCGFVLMDGLRFVDDDHRNSWQQQLVTAMGCQVKHFSSSLSRTGYPLLSDEIQHVPNLQLLRPRYNHRVYVERPEDAHTLRRLLVSDRLIEKTKGNGKPLQIGMIQRTHTRAISNINDLQAALQEALPDAQISQSTLEGFDLSQQAEFFATKHVIIAAHGAALTNALFITPGTIVLQIYPQNYFLQSLDPLIEQVDGIALDWFSGQHPIRDWTRAKSWGLQPWYRESSIAPPPEEIVNKVMGALGKRRVSKDEVVVW